MADNQQYWPLAPKQTSASDIRKVIANWPKAIGQWSTIATSDELKKKEVDKANSNPKVPTTTKKQTTTTKTNTNVVAPKQTNTVSKKPETQWVNKFASLMQGQISGDLFKNPAVQPINDIKVVKQDNEATHNAAPNNNNDISFMNNFGRAKELKAAVDIDNALMDLYSDIKVKVNNWTLASSDVSKMKQAYPEFANMWDDVLLSMIWDMASIANKKMPFNDVNMKKLKSLYPELNSAAWWFDKWSSENMYQAWWMREQMAQSSKTDLNRFWTAWAVAEWVMNPLWEATTLLDMWAQMIPQVDGSWNENRLKKALSKLTDEDINKYYEQYQNYVKNHWTLSKLYTTQLEWDTVVEQLWNWATGKWKKDVDAWFRDWLIDRVNNEVNWWAWEVTWAANELKWVWWPNVAKMYANMPASTVKTVTAITRAITNPVDTAAWLYHLFWTEEGRQALISRYGSWDWFAKALEQDPVWVASDWLAVVEWWAWLTKMAAWWLSKASLLAWLSTEALWAARTTENLLKLATRLENMAVKAGKIEKTAWLASNLWADLPINKVINWLRKWWESGESMIQKAAKYSANASQNWIWTIAGKAIDEWKKIIKEWPINTIANKLMGSASDTDKLFKAASPNLNKLTNNVNYKNKRQNMDIATQAIVDAWYTPKSLSEWAKAHTETLNKKWNEFKQMIKDKSDFEVDVKELLTEVKDYIKREREWATEAQKADLRKLEVEVNNIERRWKVDMWFIENRKEHYNSSWRDADKLKVWDIYLKWIKLIWNAMRKQQDNILGKWPEQTKKLRKEIAALMDTKEDVIKADVRNQKKKSDIAWGGLIESYWRLSGLWDFIWWTLSTLTKWWEWLAQAGKWIGKMILWNAMWRARDVDYLTKKWFEWLSNKKKAQNNVWWLKNKFQESKELWELYVERDNLRKELKKDNISNSKKEAVNKRLDDIEYAIAQKKARAWLWDKERTLSKESKKKVIDMVTKRAKDVWFTTKVLDWMEKDTQGYTDLRKKLIALEKNPWDTTAQHELFHAFFSVVDNKTKTYILDEAKKILKESWMKDVNAEEWLAESFGIYAKRKQIKLWLIDAPKGFVAKVRDFFQRVYEFMQRFNGDRATINKVFDEVLWDRKMKNWIIDLSDLLGDKEVKVRELWDNWLRNKAVYHGSPADFDKFDSSHMGEWEGAQAHGWGHYVAVDKKTAERYANMKNPSNYEYKWRWLKDIEKELWDSKPWEKVELIPIKQMLDSDWMGRYQKWERFDEIKKEWLERAKREMEYSRKIYEENPEWISGRTTNKERYEIDKRLYDAWKNLDKKDFDFEKPNRNLYTNEIPDPVKADTPTWSNYLEEKKLMSALSVQEFVDKFKEKYPEKWEQFEATVWSNSAPRYWEVQWWEMYRYLEDALWSPKAASKFLESLWYDWIHYFWARDWEAYVIFNDDALKIKDHLRYKKKIWNKEVEITPKVTSPDELIKKNADWLSVMKSFISEKQAEKALNVNKALLDKDGNPYLWTHTNKYDAPQFANFINTKDSKYKEFSDYEIAFFSNSEEMSKSYAKWRSKLANTKWYKDVEDFNKQNLTVEKSKSEQTTRKWVKIPTEYELSKWIRIIEGKSWKARIKNVIEHKYVLDTSLDKLLDDMDIAKEWYMPDNDTKHVLSRKERIERVKWEFAWNYSWWKWDVDVKELPNWKVEIVRSKNNILPEEYDSAKAAMAEYTASKTEKQPYHYQGIVTDVKKPLVVDLWKKDYWLKDWKTWEKYNTGRWWNDLGSAYDLLERSNKEWLKKLEKVNELYNKKFWELSEKRREILGRTSDLRWEYSKRYDDFNDYHLWKWERTEKDIAKLRQLDSDMANALNASFSINRLLNWEIKEINSDILDFIKSHDDYNKVYNDVLDFLKNNKDDLEYISYWDKRKDFKDWLINNWLDEDVAALLHGIRLSWDDDIIELLKNKDLETNDYVFYALKNGWYDGVIFKDILDFGSSDAFDKAVNKGWDVLVTFKSKDFKAWDNANPTNSKYISYKKKVSLDKKQEWLSKKDSNWLLAKGRERTLGNDGMRYKTNISEKDSSGKKLSEWQKKFFAGSKVVDKNGNLLRVYHWTVAWDFTVFQKYWNRTSNNIASDVWFWFTPNKKWAINFAKESSWRWDNKARAEEVYLDIKNPKVYEPSEFNLKNYEERDKLIDSKYKEVYAARNEMNKYDYNHFWMWEYTHENHVNRWIFNKLEYIYDQKWKITEADLKDIKEEYWKINWDWYYKPDIDATYEDFKNYLQAKKKYEKLNDEYLEMKHSDSYDDFKADIYKLDNKKRDKLDFALDDMDATKKYIDNLKKEWYDGIIIKWTEYDWATLWEWARNDQYVAFDSNQIKRITNENPTKNEDIRYKKGLTAKDQTQTPEFKKWFEGSKVVDKSWKPLEVYHNTDSDFTEFDINKTKTWLWHFFTSDKKYLNWLKNKMSVYLDIKNPLIASPTNKISKQFPELKKLMERPEESKNWSFDERVKYEQMLDKKFDKELRKILKREWYDWVFYEDEKWNVDQFVALDPSQIKSATDNIWTFDKNNPDIRYKKVYHGSHADFDRFDSSHMWEWEWNQAHGWGHYVAVDKGTAERYANMLWWEKKNNIVYKWEVRDAEKYQNRILTKLDEVYQLNYWGDDIKWFKEDFPEIKEWILKDLKRQREYRIDDWAYDKKHLWDNPTPAQLEKLEREKKYVLEIDKQIKEVESIKPEDVSFKETWWRNLYTNEIPDPVKADTPTGNNYLEEDAKLTWEELKDFSKAYWEELKYSQIMELARDYKNRKGEMPNWKWLYETIWILEWMDKQRKLWYVIWQSEEQKAASKFLESLWYDWIHYYWGRDWEAYVIFNDDAIEIKDHLRYKKWLQKKGNWLDKKSNASMLAKWRDRK